METCSSIESSGLTNQQRESIDRISLLTANLSEDRKQIFESEVFGVNKEGMKTLILRIPEDRHKALKMFAASVGKNMTELLNEWIDEKTKETKTSAKAR